MTRLYLDDLRQTGARTREGTDVEWEHVYTYAEAISRLMRGDITHISLDHDLDAEGALESAMTGTGYDVACWIEREAASGRLPRMTWECHSMNPIGRQRIIQAMEGADRQWDLVESSEKVEEK